MMRGVRAIQSQDVLRKSFNAYPLSRFHHSAAETACVIGLMNNLERIMAMSREFQVPLTEYFNYSAAFSLLVREYHAQIATAPTRGEADRLEAELIWHFKSHMMTTGNPRPEDSGLTLEDFRTSFYCIDRAPRAIEKAFRHPERWEDRLFGCTKDFADNAALSAVYVCGIYAPELEDLLKIHHIPYRFADPASLSPKLIRHLAETGVGASPETWGDRLVLIYPAVYSMFMQFLMRCALIDVFFTPEEKAEGASLYQTGQFYGFSIPLTRQLVLFLKGRGIELYAHDLFQLRVLSGFMDVYCFVPLRQKLLVDASLMDYAAMQSYTHSQGCAKFYSASELRIPEWGGLSHHVAICDYGYQADAIIGGVPTDTDYYNLLADEVPNESLEAKGVLIDRPSDLAVEYERLEKDETPRKIPDEASFSWFKV